jgi:hypothetical protein
VPRSTIYHIQSNLEFKFHGKEEQLLSSYLHGITSFIQPPRSLHLVRFSPCLTNIVSIDIRIVKHILAIRVKGRVGIRGLSSVIVVVWMRPKQLFYPPSCSLMTYNPTKTRIIVRFERAISSNSDLSFCENLCSWKEKKKRHRKEGGKFSFVPLHWLDFQFYSPTKFPIRNNWISIPVRKTGMVLLYGFKGRIAKTWRGPTYIHTYTNTYVRQSLVL